MLTNLGSRERLILQTRGHDENANLSSSSPAIMQPLQTHTQNEKQHHRPRLSLHVSYTIQVVILKFSAVGGAASVSECVTIQARVISEILVV